MAAVRAAALASAAAPASSFQPASAPNSHQMQNHVGGSLPLPGAQPCPHMPWVVVWWLKLFLDPYSSAPQLSLPQAYR